VVLTFAPTAPTVIPITFAISQFATAAIVAAAMRAAVIADPHAPRSPMPWPSSTTSPRRERLEAYQSVVKKLVSWWMASSASHALARVGDTTVIDTRATWETAWAAISCHESQIASYQRLKELGPKEHEALWAGSRSTGPSAR